MTDINFPISKYEKVFQKLPIILKEKKRDLSEVYSILDKKGNEIGSFSYATDGYVSSLKLNKNVRRKKTGLDALFSLRDFLNKITKEKGLDYFEFHTDLDNPHNLKKLYQHLGLDFIDTDTNGWHFIGIVNPEKKEDVLNSIDFYSMSNGLGNLFNLFKEMFFR